MDAYLILIDELLATRRLARLGDTPSPDSLLLRHDVDVHLGWALQLGLAEAAQGLHATYFLSLQAPTFNLMCQDGREAVSALFELGHQVGLHVDARWVEQETWQPVCAWLGLATDMVTFHAPTSAWQVEPCVRILPSALSYRSDSGGSWRHGEPSGAPAGLPLLLNTHPIWWVPPGTREQRLTAAVTKSSMQAVLEWLPRLGEDIKGVIG
ncbi:MAG TPA: hypothetical protein VG388_06275 [Solirubrobacteraceae bacterium]|jgi:hypothetical protein|nr:hypothetical protein [Solirubrobacteraceae bacterium]